MAIASNLITTRSHSFGLGLRLLLGRRLGDLYGLFGGGGYIGRILGVLVLLTLLDGLFGLFAVGSFCVAAGSLSIAVGSLNLAVSNLFVAIGRLLCLVFLGSAPLRRRLIVCAGQYVSTIDLLCMDGG